MNLKYIFQITFIFVILQYCLLKKILSNTIICYSFNQFDQQPYYFQKHLLMKLVNSKQSAKQKDINAQLRQIRKQKYQQNLEQKKIFQHLIKNNIELDLKKPQQSKILYNGIPEMYRQLVWPQLLKNNHGITVKTYQILLNKVVRVIEEIQNINKNQQLHQLQLIKAKSQGYAPSQQLNLNLQKLSKWFETIRLDIPRTFSQMKIFQSFQLNSSGSNSSPNLNISSHNINHNSQNSINNSSITNPQSRSLYNILTAWSIYRQDIGYKQGMSQIAGYLLIQLNNNQIKSFQLFCSLITTDVLYEFFILNLEYISLFCKKISYRLKQRNQELYEFFQSNQLDYKLFVLDWIYSLFTKCFQLDTIGKVWDILLLNSMEQKFLVNVCVQIICSFEQEIVGFRNNNSINGQQFDAMGICRFLKKAKVDQIRENRILAALKEIRN